jgi:hypothetical protein
MTFYKYLVILGLLLTGWSVAWGADSTSDGASSSSASDTDSTGLPKPVHHRKHHSTKSPSTATGASATGSSSSSQTGTASTEKKKTDSAKKEDTAGTDETAKKTDMTKKETASTTQGASEKKKSDVTSSHTNSRHHHHTGETGTEESKSGTSEKKTGKTAETKSSEKSPAAPSASTTSGEKMSTNSAAATEKEAGTPPDLHAKLTESTSTKGGGVPAEKGNAGAAPTPEATVTEPHVVMPGTVPVTTSTHHHHHHDQAPTIVVTPSSVPLQEQLAPAVSSPAPLGSAALNPAPTVSVGPTVETGLPVGRPGAATTASLPINIENHNALPQFQFTDYPPLPHRATRTYPWKTNIITTVFWIGEGGSTLSSTTNIQSAWDMNWIHHNGGTDDPDEMSKMSGYSSLTHASTLNPFYIALPFNDLAYPEKAERWLPPGWYKPTHHGEKPVSACQGRWIEIKTRSGRVCYAQWEDVGPLVSDHAEYVFGPERPDTLTRAGLDVSPAVAKYLGFDSTALTSWRFVDDTDVQPGMWLRYDEQAILFQALKEQIHPTKTPRIQDLEEPVPDGSAQDSSEKRSGAARG